MNVLKGGHGRIRNKLVVCIYLMGNYPFWETTSFYSKAFDEICHPLSIFHSFILCLLNTPRFSRMH